MNGIEAFAAQRGKRMVDSDDELRPLVASALDHWTEDGAWYHELVTAAGVLFLETFDQEAPRADRDKALDRFRDQVSQSLAKTARPHDPPTDGEIERLTYWLTTYTVNHATYHGNRARGGKGMRWVTRHDRDVRAEHRAVDGVVASADGTFKVGGYDLHYPGETVGPPEIWINCRCLLAPARIEASMSADTIVAAAEEPVIEDGEDDLPEDELEDGEEEITEIPVHGVATIEGRPTGDGREFAVGSLHFGRLPQPLGYEYVSTHGGDTSMVAIIGRIDRFWTTENPEGYSEARWSGVVFPGKEHSGDAIQGIVDGSIGGVSVIVDAVEVDVADQREEVLARIRADREGEGESELTDEQIADMMVGDGKMPVTKFSSARIRRFDMVPTPAYQEAYIAIGDRFYDELDDAEKQALTDCGCNSGMSSDQAVDDDADAVAASAFAPGTKDGPGWITHPTATARIRRYWVKGKGAAKISWGVPGDFNRCRLQLGKYVQNPEWLAGLCANMHKEAIGVWPGQEGGGGNRGHHAVVASAGSDVPLMALVAAGGTVKPAAKFKNPNLTGPTAVTIEGDHIYGHLATWGVCHVGIQNACVTAPHSTTNYAQYRTGAVMTDEGLIPVGNITMGTGHADLRMKAAEAAAHYDHTGTVVADVSAGEDRYGIWVSGMLRRNLSDEKIDALRASALSGDWRRHGVGMELHAALAVNVPGFPVPRTGLAASAAVEEGDIVGLEMQESLVAAGIVLPDNVDTDMAVAEVVEFDVKGMVREVIEEMHARDRRQKRLAALAPLIEKDRAMRANRIMAKFGGK